MAAVSPEPPSFLDYSPADVVSMGVEQGLPPERIAQGLMKHRTNVEGYGRERHAEDPDKYFKGAVQLDKDIEQQLGQVRLSAERAALSEALPDVTAQQRLVSQLEAGGYDPEALDDDLKPALDRVLKVRENEAFQMPVRSYGGAVKVGETTLARYAMREAGDGMMDVSLAFDDDSTDVVRVPKVTRDDVKAEFARRRQAVEAAVKAQEANRRGGVLDPVAGSFGTTQTAAELEKARGDLAALIEGQETYLQAERVREALKDPKFRDRAGQYAGWTEFLKGAADATISSGALLSRVAGRDDWMRELAAGQQALDTALPGSTRRELEGGTWNESVSGAQRALGMMAPMIATGVATRLGTAAVGAEAELARQAAGRLGVAGAGMSASATGGAYLDTQREIDAAEAAGNFARANRIRLGRDLHALLTGAAEGAVERLGAAQALNVGRGVRALTRDLASEAVEEPLTGLIQRGVVDPITIDRQADITGPLATEALTGLLAAGPLVGSGAAVQRLAGQGTPAAPAAAVPAAQGPVNAPAPAPAPATAPAAQPVTPLVGVAQRAGTVQRVTVPQSVVESGLADPGMVEGDVLGMVPGQAVNPDARFMPPPEMTSGLADLGTVEGDLLAQVPARVTLNNETPTGNVSTAGVDSSGPVVAPVESVVVDEGATAEIPLGMMRPFRPDATLERLNDQEFEIQARAGLQLVDQMEQQMDDRPELLNDPSFRGRLAAAQDASSAIELEQLRRRVAQQFEGDVFADALQMAGSLPAPTLEALESSTGSRLGVLIRSLRQTGFTDADVREGLSFADRLMRDPDYREVSASRVNKLKQWVDFIEQNEGGGFTNTQVVARLNDGSTVIFGELVNLAARAVQAGVTFARWSADMIRRLGEAVRQYLRDAWAAARKTSRQGFLHPGDLPGVLRQRMGLQPNAPFRVRQLAARDLLLGSPLPAEFAPLVARSEREAKAVEQVASQLARDLQAAETAAVNDRGLPLDRLHGHVTDFMNGVPAAGPVLSAMDPVTFERARRMRNFLDDLSAEVAATLPVGSLRNALVNNMGSWLRRSYAAFDPNSGWNYTNLMNAAAKGREVGGKPALDVLRAGAAFLHQQGGYGANQLTSQGLPVAGSELESDMRDLMDRDKFERSMTGMAGVSKNVTSLMQRKTMPAEIRALMGEETNVVKRFLNSASFQAQFIRRHHAQVAMRRVGLAAGLLSSSRQGVFTQEIPTDGPQWAGLAGMWTTPELWEAMKRAAGVVVAGSDIASYLGRFLRFTSSKAKLNRVAMNPDSWVVNGLGGTAMMLMNGDWFSGRVGARLMESVRLMRAGRAKSGDVINAAEETLRDIQRDMIARLTAEGVLGQGLTAADIEASLPRATLQWIEMNAALDRTVGAVEGALVGQGLGRGLGATWRVVGGVVGGAAGAVAGAQRIRTVQQRMADLAMTKPDMLFRLTGFLTNYEAALGAGLSPDAAFNQAAERTLNTFPNYAAVPAFVRSLSQFGLINSFVSFMYEMYRNTAWSMRYLMQDLAGSTPAERRRGLQRLAGAGAVGGLMAGGLQGFLATLLGDDDEKEVGTDDERNAIFTRWFAAPWEKDAVLAFTQFDNKGVSYLNTSYIMPQQILGELAMAVRNGENPADSAARVIVRLQEQFAGDSVNLAPLMQAYTNTDTRGRPVTVRKGVEGGWERVDHALKVIAEPGFAEKVNRLMYAYRDAERRGRTFSVEQEFRRVIGLREMTRTWDELTLNRYREFGREVSNIREGANRTLGENLPGAQKEAVERANRELDALRVNLNRFEKEALKLGVPSGTLMRAKRESGVNAVRNVGIDPMKGNRIKTMGR